MAFRLSVIMIFSFGQRWSRVWVFPTSVRLVVAVTAGLSFCPETSIIRMDSRAYFPKKTWQETDIWLASVSRRVI